MTSPSPDIDVRRIRDFATTPNAAVAALATRMDDALAGAADFLDDNSPEAQVARLRAEAARLPVDPTLLPLIDGVPDEAAITAPVPEVRATTEERFKDFAVNGITHVVIS